MTHFTVAVLLRPEDFATAEATIDRLMAPFDENLTVEPYVCNSLEQSARDLAAEIRDFERILAEGDRRVFNLERCREELERLQSLTAEDFYAERNRFHKRFNAAGEPISTRNPDAKWDWYCIGGRWDGWITGREEMLGASERRGNLADNAALTEQAIQRRIIPHAIL